jgi:hypothetical protein
MASQAAGNTRRNGAKLHSRVKILGVFPEHDQVNSFLIVERIPEVSLARSKADIEIKELPHSYDRRTIETGPHHPPPGP